MPTYNSENFIRNSIDSVLSQTYKNWELIIVDDYSIDKTASIINEYSISDKRINYRKLNTNSGAAVARNEAIKLARGVYIAFLDSDDLWSPYKLEIQISYMKKNKYNFTCTDYNKIDENGNDLGIIIKSNNKSDYNSLLRTCPGNSTVIYNAYELGKIEVPDIKKRNDYVMWLKVIKVEKNLYGLNKNLASHRIRNGSLSKNKYKLVYYHWYVYRKIEKLSIIKSVSLISYWIIVTFFKLRN